ncbi:methyltransferase domain-containing protein [Actinoallomurus oryzae]|uniref:Protein-L-isoaspartate O-methyltransferase n=1 Tax=Actinoallomurus oryzae TaxID=502180 RepID=A0ABP8QQY6_9ACTN
MTDPDVLADRLAARLAAQGELNDPVWRRALHAVPRHLFAPPVAWVNPDGPADGYPVNRATGEDRWWSAVYSDASLITQMNDGVGDVTTGEGLASSSCSAPGVVCVFLEELRLEDHDRVLEVGTGTGWTAGLLSWRVGDVNVTSVEIDPGLSEQAAKNLAAAGFEPRLVVGDGAVGFPEAAPFDRVHVACAVADIPYSWVRQTRPGGIIVLPWSPGYGYGWQTRLHVMPDGTAVGGFPGRAGYMLMRAQRPVLGAAFDFVHGTPDETVTRLDPRRLVADSDAADLAVAAQVPGVQTRLYFDEDGDTGEATFWVLERETKRGSWASVDYVPGRAEFVVQQYGGRRLWDEVEAAYWRWNGWGRPERDRFGLTISPDGQVVWLDSPRNVLAR